VREIAGIPPLSELPAGNCEQVDAIERQGYRIEKLLIHTGEDVRIPALAFVPSRTRDDAYLYVHGESKSADADGPIADLVRKGHLVLSIDPRGCGELRPESTRQYDPNVFLAYLLDLSYIGMRAADILIAARLLSRYRPRRKPYRVHLIGIGEAGPAALHAAALEPRTCASLTLRNSLVSWSRLVRAPEASLEFLVHTVHQALRTYDLPDLLTLLPASKVAVEDPLDPADVPVRP
jgi:pimeloyl-ACP methyl ester carboxylesterase